MLQGRRWQLFLFLLLSVSLSIQHDFGTQKKAATRDPEQKSRSHGSRTPGRHAGPNLDILTDDDDDDDDDDVLRAPKKRRKRHDEDEYDVDELADVEEYDGQVWWEKKGLGRRQADMGGGRAKYVWMSAGEATDGPYHCYGARKTCRDQGSTHVWEAWAEFSACSVTCGSGVRVRHRKCPSDGRCHGASMEEESCVLAACPNNKADKPQSEHIEVDSENAGEPTNEANDFENEAAHEDEAENKMAGEEHEGEAQDEFQGEGVDDSPGDRSYRDFSGDDVHGDDVSGGEGQPEAEETIESQEYQETKSERQREGEGAEGRGEKGREEQQAQDDDDDGGQYDDDTPNDRGPGGESPANDDLLTDDDDDDHEEKTKKGKRERQGDDEEDEEEEDKDEEEEKKGRRRRKKKRKKKKKRAGSGGSELSSSSSSSSSESSGSWSYESTSTSDSEAPSERPHTLAVTPDKGALSLHIRPRASSYGALSSPNADIDDDIRETDDNMSPLTPPGESPLSYVGSKGGTPGEEEDYASANSSLFRIGMQGPWQYGSGQNFEDQFTIASQYAMPVEIDPPPAANGGSDPPQPSEEGARDCDTSDVPK